MREVQLSDSVIYDASVLELLKEGESYHPGVQLPGNLQPDCGQETELRMSAHHRGQPSGGVDGYSFTTASDIWRAGLALGRGSWRISLNFTSPKFIEITLTGERDDNLRGTRIWNPRILQLARIRAIFQSSGASGTAVRYHAQFLYVAAPGMPAHAIAVSSTITSVSRRIASHGSDPGVHD